MLETLAVSLPSGLPVLAITGSVGIVGAAVALGIRHGIDWDHIAAITDITSTTAGSIEEEEAWLVREPGVMLTDETHHSLAHQHEGAAIASAEGGRRQAPAAVDEAVHAHGSFPLHHPHHHAHAGEFSRNGHAVAAFVRKQRPALVLGTMYALGHGSIVFALGLLALLAKEFLPDWIDPVMERVVGVTLLFLAAYLFYSLYRYFRGQGDFRLRSRWMLVFAAVRNAFEAARAKLFRKPHRHVHEAQRYGVRTSFGIGMIHGVGAETGTQVLVITTAVGAGSQAMGVVALAGFIAGLLFSNSVVTVISTMGFVSSRQRQWVYVGAGLLAALFSLFVGLFFILRAADALPDLNQYFSWIGGGN